MLLQLNPTLPVQVVSGTVEGHTWTGPTGAGMALFVNDNGPDQHLSWVIMMDATGQIWEVKNPFVRGMKNITWGRHAPKVEESCKSIDLSGQEGR